MRGAEHRGVVCLARQLPIECQHLIRCDEKRCQRIFLVWPGVLMSIPDAEAFFIGIEGGGALTEHERVPTLRVLASCVCLQIRRHRCECLIVFQVLTESFDDGVHLGVNDAAGFSADLLTAPSNA